jgi:hypothetical protein
MNYFCHKNIMGSGFFDLSYLTFYIHRRFHNNGSFHLLCHSGSELHGFEFIIVFSTSHTTPIGCKSQIFGSEIDHKIACSFYNIITVTVFSNRCIQHWRIAVHGAGPGNGNDIEFFGFFATAQHYRRYGIDHSSRFPL